MNKLKTQDIFNFIQKGIDNIYKVIIDMEHRSMKQSIEQFRIFEYEFKANKKQLENNTEWDNFSIAFYGETNAGKSTIIEMLRIYFNEYDKCEQQRKFSSIYTHFNDLLQSLDSTLQDLESRIQQTTEQIQYYERIYTLESKNLWGRLKIFCGLSKSKKQLKILSNKYLTLQKHLNEIRYEINLKKCEMLEKLKTCCDGLNISTQTDFTQKVTTYNIEFNNTSFALLDLPGIEGKEENLISEIKKATMKAHCIFCVVRDKIEEGTLNTIKDGLGDQTEVWLVFNQSATSPHALKSSQDGENKQMKAMEQKLKDILGENYKGMKSIFALPGFLSQSSCLLPNIECDNNDTQHFITQKNQQKFLCKYDGSQEERKTLLFRESGCQNFAMFIQNNIIENVKDKIRKNIFNKANKLLENFNAVVFGFSVKLKELYKTLKNNIESLKDNLDNIYPLHENRFKSIIDKELRTFENEIRNIVYKEIDKDVSDKQFKDKTENILESKIKELEEKMEQSLKQQAYKLQTDIEELFKDFDRKINNAITLFQQLTIHNKINYSFSETNSGISWYGLIGASIGAVGLVFIPFSTPLALILGGIGIVVSIFKSVHKVFSSNYKKSQQKNSLNNTLDGIIKNIKEECNSYIENYMHETKKQCEAMQKNMDKEIEKYNNSVKMFNKINDELRLLLQTLK